MTNYVGQECPVCKEKFAAQSDVVVCPDCGTPYHRICYQKIGHCVHASEHAAGFEWVPVGGPAPEPAHTAAPDAASAAAGQRGPIYQRAETDNAGSSAAGMASPFRRAQQTAAPRQMQPDDLIDGIKAKDWAAYLGRSIPYYLVVFQRMAATGQKMAVSFSAFVFGPFFLLYRKMWTLGFGYLAFCVALRVPVLLLWAYIAGVLPGMDPNLLVTISEVASTVNWAAMVVCGMFSVHFYRKQAQARIRAICTRLPEGQERSLALASAGGTSLAAVIVTAVVLFILLSAFFSRFIGLEGLNTLMNYMGYPV